MTFIAILTILKKYWKYIVGVILALFILTFLFKACQPEYKIDQQQIQQINSANEKQRKEALQEVFQQINDTQSVNDKKIAEADKKVEESKKQTGHDVTAEELEKLLRENK